MCCVKVRKLEEHLAKASRQLGKAVARELQLEAGVAGVRQAMHFAEVSKEKTKGRFFDQSAQYMTRQ